MTDESSVELVVARTAQELAEVLAGMREAPEPSAEEQQQQRFSIIAEMLAAETEEELWAETPTISSKFALGCTFRIDDVHAYRSKFEDSESGIRGGFLAARAVLVEGSPVARIGDRQVQVGAGESVILNTGAARLGARIGWYKLHDKLPVTITVVKRSETAEGYPIVDAELVEP